ncbi:hypothetical protein [Paraburkholderia piptadeniae]|nr:hypothetical protein [Paraburkholderia piptadeniae]
MKQTTAAHWRAEREADVELPPEANTHLRPPLATMTYGHCS